jgi:hypothetical protein
VPDGRSLARPRGPIGGSRKLEDRANWVQQEWLRRPGLRFAETIAATRDKFGCGKTAAEQAYKRARKRVHDAFAAVVPPEQIVAMYLNLYEQALNARRFNMALRLLNSLSDGRFSRPPLPPSPQSTRPARPTDLSRRGRRLRPQRLHPAESAGSASGVVPARSRATTSP